MLTSSNKNKIFGVTKQQLELLITKICNRCNPNDYETFGDLLNEIEKTAVNGDPTFLTEEEIKLIESNPEIEKNILKMCSKVVQKRTFSENTIEYIIFKLNMSGTKKSEKFKSTYYISSNKNLKFLTEPESKPLKGTIEEVLIMLDLSIIPYK